MFLRFFGRYLPGPLFLLVHITLRCNQHCPWCYQKKDVFFRSFSRDIAVSDFQLLLEQSVRFWPHPHIHLYGGEPFAHPRFSDLLECCGRYRLKPTLTTNGLDLKSRSEELLKSPLSQLNISVNNAFFPDEATNDVFLDGLFYFLRLNKGEKTVNLNWTVTPENHRAFERLLEILRKTGTQLGVAAVVCQHRMVSEQERQTLIPTKTKALMSMVANLKQMRFPFKLWFLPDIRPEDIERYYCSPDAFRNECYVPWAGLSVYPDLQVGAGAGLFACKAIVGNLQESSLKDVWAGERLRRFRENLRFAGLPRECGRCCQKLYY